MTSRSGGRVARSYSDHQRTARRSTAAASAPDAGTSHALSLARSASQTSVRCASRAARYVKATVTPIPIQTSADRCERRSVLAPASTPTPRAPAAGRGPTTALLVGYFFNNVLPLRAGEAIRIVSLNRRTGTSRVETTATVVVERAFDVLALLLILFAMANWLPDVAWLQTAAFVLVALGIILLGAAFALARWGTGVLRILLYPLSWIPYLSADRFERALRNLVQGFVGLHSVRVAVVAFFWTLLSWMFVALSFWLVLLGFDLGLSPLAGMLVVIAINLALVLPSSPAAVGVFEWATVIALDAYGVQRSEALSYALVVHALNFVPFVAAGVLLLHRDALRRP